MGYNPALEPAAAALYADNAGMKAGPFILGFFVDAILMGILASHYFRWQTWSRPQESLPIKLLVWYTWIFAIAQTIFLVVLNMRVFGRLIVSLPGHHVADKGVYHFGRWAIFFDKSMVAWTPMLEAAARTPISIYFAARAYRLGRNSKLFIIVIAPLFLASFAFAGAVWAIVDQKDLFQNLMGKAPIYMWIGAEVASDVIITAFLSYHLIQSRTGWKQTDKVISRLLVLAIETQLPPTLFAFIFLIISAVDRHTPLGSFFCFIPKVYGISLLIILNKRYSLRREMEDETSTYKNNGKGTYGLRSRRGVSTGNIQVTTETIQHVDEFRPQASEGDVKDEPDSPRESTVQVLDYSSSETRLTKPSSDSSID